MPRKSSSAITALRPLNVAHTRLEPRDDASPEVRDTFREIVMAVRPEHFRKGDEHLIEQYAQSILIARTAYAELELTGSVTAEGKTSPGVVVLEKAHRSAAALSQRLRLCPQARASARTVGNAKPPPPARKIWENY